MACSGCSGFCGKTGGRAGAATNLTLSVFAVSSRACGSLTYLASEGIASAPAAVYCSARKDCTKARLENKTARTLTHLFPRS